MGREPKPPSIWWTRAERVEPLRRSDNHRRPIGEQRFRRGFVRQADRQPDRERRTRHGRLARVGSDRRCGVDPDYCDDDDDRFRFIEGCHCFDCAEDPNSAGWRAVGAGDGGGLRRRVAAAQSLVSQLAVSSRSPPGALALSAALGRSGVRRRIRRRSHRDLRATKARPPGTGH